MTTRSGPDAADSGRGRADPGLDAIMRERRQLINLAYRLPGSLAEAEDAVQETYARWYAMSAQQLNAIASPGAWLTTVASRICLNLLGSARARRETYVGEWIPEPLPEPTEWITGRPGMSHDGLPIGLSPHAARAREDLLLAAAESLESRLGPGCAGNAPYRNEP